MIVKTLLRICTNRVLQLVLELAVLEFLVELRQAYNEAKDHYGKTKRGEKDDDPGVRRDHGRTSVPVRD